MSRTVLTGTRSQQALQSYLDGLLQDAAIELADSVSQDEFQAAVLEEQLRDARISQPPRLEIVQPTPPAPPVVVAPEAPEIPAPAPVHAAAPIIALAAAAQPVDEPTAIVADRHPGWGDEPFECLLFDVAGLTLAVGGGLVLLLRRPLHRQVGLALLILLDLLLAAWGLTPTVERALYAGSSETGAALAADPTVERIFWPLQGRPEAGYDLKFGRYFRFDTFGPHDLAYWRSLRETLLPNLGMLDGVATANNFEPLRVGWYDAAVRAADDPQQVWQLGVTHLVTATSAGQVSITPLPDALGRAWVVPAAAETSADEVTFSRAESVPAPITLHDVPNRVTIHAVLDRPGYLVLADTWYPGWEAAVDGETVPLLRANYAFRAVYLEAGEHTVEMVYRPLSVRVGGWVSLVALTVLVGGWLVACRRERQT